MVYRTATSVLLLALGCVVCYGQTSFQEITPGASTRDDVARVLGQPARSISATLFEYNPPAGIARVEVGYSAGSSVVERLEVYFLKPISRSALLQKFNLPQQPAAKTTDAEGKLVEYFGDSSLLTLTYRSADAASGVSHIGYYSKELFARVVAKAPGARQNPGTQAGTSRSGSGTAGLGEMSLPEYMRPPAGGTSVTVDRSGRTVKPSNHPGATGDKDADSVEMEIDLSVDELRRLVGRYQFTITSVPGLKLAVVGLVAGKLKLTMGSVSNTLVPIAGDDFVVGDQGESEVLRFKVAGKPGVKVYFQISGDKIERLFMIEHQRQPKRFSVATPQP